MQTHTKVKKFISHIFIYLTFACCTLAQASHQVSHQASHQATQAILADYVNTPDAQYDFTPVGTPTIIPGARLEMLHMTSQQWRNEAQASPAVWTHWLLLIIPDKVQHHTALMWVKGGSNTSPPSPEDIEVQVAIALATATGTVAAVVGQIPNQPLQFPDVDAPLREDALVAYSWDKAMSSGDYTWAAYVPMVKSVVRALDTTQRYMQESHAIAIDDFVLTGFSKRGAVTWLTAAVDARVRAIAPGVFDFLSFARNLEHHFSAYGFYSSALEEYLDWNIIRRLRSPEGKALRNVVDPIQYRESLNLPKFLLNASGDQFTPPDSARFFLPWLSGETLLNYVPNTDHSLANEQGDVTAAATSLLGWYATIISEQPRPKIRWWLIRDKLYVWSDQTPSQALSWRAHNPSARDFRFETLGAAWTSEVLEPNGHDLYVLRLETPATGWTAQYVALSFMNAAGIAQTYSTRVFVMPHKLPFEVKDEIDQPQTLASWHERVVLALQDETQAATLNALLPIPLLDQHVNDLHQAQAILSADPNDAANRARQECLAARLNIAEQRLGWYSPVAIFYRARPLWLQWELMRQAYFEQRFSAAQWMCRQLNTASVAH